MNYTLSKGNLEGRLREMTRFESQCLETNLEFSGLSEQVLRYGHNGNLYSLLGVATIKRQFEKVKRKEEDIKLRILRRQQKFKDMLKVDCSFQFDGRSYSLEDARQINTLLRSLNTGLVYVLEKGGAFIGKVGDKRVDEIGYKEVDEIGASGHFQTGACYITKTGNEVREGEIYIFKNSSRKYKDDLGRYVFASWGDGTSISQLRKYYGIKDTRQFNSSEKIENDLTLLTIYHELGHNHSLAHFKEHLDNIVDHPCFSFIKELAADYFEEHSTIGMVNSLAKRKPRRARQLLALTTVEQNERPKMKHERERYEKAFRAAAPYLTNIIESKNFSGELSRFVRAQRKYIKDIILGVKKISDFDRKIGYISERNRYYESDLKKIYDHTKPEQRRLLSLLSIF